MKGIPVLILVIINTSAKEISIYLESVAVGMNFLSKKARVPEHFKNKNVFLKVKVNKEEKLYFKHTLWNTFPHIHNTVTKQPFNNVKNYIQSIVKHITRLKT